MKRVIIPVILGLFLQPVHAATSVAVSQLAANGVSQSEAASLTDALRNELIKSGKFQVLERSQMEEILKEQGFQQSGLCDETACAVEIGKMLSVNQVFLGSIGKVGKTYTLTVRAVDVNTGKVLQGVTENYKGEVDNLLTDIIPIVAGKLLGTYKKRSKGPVIAVTVGLGVGAAILVPVLYLTRSKDKPSNPATTDLDIKWGN